MDLPAFEAVKNIPSIVLNAAARTNPDLLPRLLQKYRTRYQTRATEP